jgi:hypothetical protein
MNASLFQLIDAIEAFVSLAVGSHPIDQQQLTKVFDSFMCSHIGTFSTSFTICVTIMRK